jgi:hypothetical protein
VVFGQAGSWEPAPDLIENTRKGIETLVRLGDIIASSSRARADMAG